MGSAPSKRSSHRRGRAPPGRTDEDRQSRRQGTGQEGASETRRPDSSAAIRETLASYNDTQLYRVTRFYKLRLQRAIEEFVEELSSSLAGKTIFKEEHEKVQELVEKGQRSEAASYLLDIVMENGARGGRAMWAALRKVKSSRTELRSLLKEIQEQGPYLPLLATWNHLELELPDYQTVIQTAQRRHKEKMREEMERAGAPIPGDYPDLVAISTVREDLLAAHEQLARGAARRPARRVGGEEEGGGERDKEEEEEEEQRQRGCFSKQAMEPVAAGRELFGLGFGRAQPGGLTVLGGAAGVGKTSALRRLAGEWASSEAGSGPGAVYPQFQFLLHFELAGVAEPASLHALTLSAYPHLAAELAHLWRGPEGLLLLFDGLDELPGWPGESGGGGPAPRDPREEGPLPGVLWALARGAMLPGCCVLMAGRPEALQPLRAAGARLWAEVVGLGQGARRAYALRLQGGQAGEGARAPAEGSDYLWGLCCEPAYCWLACSSPGAGVPPPRTATQLLAGYLHGALRQQADGDPLGLVVRAGQMALEGLARRSGLFGEEDLRRHGLEPSRLEPALVRGVPGGAGAAYAFHQPALQEFVAALAQYLAPERQDLLELLRSTQEADDGRYRGFLRSLLGLSARISTRQLEELLPPLPHHSVCEAILWLEGQVQAEAKKKELSRRHLLPLAHYLHEGRNRRLASLLARSVSRVSLGSDQAEPGSRLDLPDCAALSYVFQHCDSVNTLSFDNCYVQAEGVKHLLPAFLNCKRLSLVGNNLCDEGVRILCMVLRDPDCKVTELELARNGLTWACTVDLISALVSNPSINGLSLNKNDLGDIGVQQLAEGLQHPDCKVEIIQLDSNCLTEASAQGLSAMLQAHTELRWLILDKNQLGERGLRKLAEGIRNCRLHRLGLGFNSLTDVAAEELISALCVNRTIQFLYLTGNYFTDRCVPSFVTLIQTCRRLRKIWLGRNPLSTESKQVLLSEQASRADLKVML